VLTRAVDTSSRKDAGRWARLAEQAAPGGGGLLYTAGAISYHRRRPDPYPSAFGYHEVFHACVCAAATCQFIAIALFIG
jgi:channel protein (hemolysin III family)